MKQQQITIKDNENIKNILIQVDFKNGKTGILSNFSAWENLALIMEGLGVTAEKCIQEGMSKKKVYDEIKNYIMKVLGDYQIRIEDQKRNSLKYRSIKKRYDYNN